MDRLIELVPPTASVLDVWFQLPRVVSTWAAVNPEYLVMLPRIDMESFGSRLYISAVPSSPPAAPCPSRSSA